jgi:hypothetical protein
MRRGLAYVLTAATVLASAGASAQIKPRIMIIFDTSGSMLDGNSRDGSPLCGNQGTTSRIYQLKVALFETLQGVGAQEVDWSLATFPMFVDPMRTPRCPDHSSCNTGVPPNTCAGHYFVTDAQDSESNSAREGCKISTHSPATQQSANCGATSNPCAAWYNDYKKEVLKVGFGSTPEQVMFYFDQQEDAGQVPVLTNPEVRCGEGWYTPLGKSLFYAHGYFHKEVVLPSTSPLKPCERNVVILFTDGEETCNESSTNAFYPTKWATNLKNLGVTVNVVAIDNSDPLLGQIATNGGGKSYFVAGNTAALKLAVQTIIADSLPPSESCNSKDDNCNSLVDEDFPLKGQACDNGKLGSCYKTGTYVCKGDGTGVVCNAPDATGTTEICNGLDDDCDGEIDEIPGCLPCLPQPEICNGKDDDCNGQTDENIAPVPCGKDVGECTLGTATCTGGKLVCSGGIGPTPELCDGKDNDCDGVVDGMAEPCYPFATGCDLKTGLCVGSCSLGTRICQTGVWSACVGALGPQKEVCDGIDNDCDGQLDEDAECPAGQKCLAGECVGPCTGNEFSCPAGMACKDGWCVPDECKKIKCPEGQFCKSGVCVDPCLGKSCGPQEKCIGGVCIDQSCYNPANACPAGERCIEGSCKKDPCAGVTCKQGEYCFAGECRLLCEGVVCKQGERCVQGKCLVDPCVEVSCGPSEACVVVNGRGTCIINPCLGAVPCGKGKVCVLDEQGKPKCITDPCDNTACPTGYVCSLGDCVLPNALSTTELLASGGGGCACELSPGGGLAAPWGILGLGVALLLCGLRRRRD